MAILTLIKDPDPLLRQKSVSVEKIDEEFKEFMSSLLETMYHEEGIGIAAIQGQPVFIINPKITYLSEESIILSEGCLSVRKEDGVEYIEGGVLRPKSIGIEYIDLEGNSKDMLIDGDKSNYDLWFARCLQHEMDHLDGILFIDKLVENIQYEEVLE